MKRNSIIKKSMKRLSDNTTMIDIPENRLVFAGGVYRVIQIGNKTPYVALTAFRKGYSLEENQKRNSNLLKEIKSLGVHAYSLIGFYKECPEGKKDCKDEERIAVEEDSFFVPFRSNAFPNLETFLEKLVNLGMSYNQDAVLIGLPDAYSGYDKKEIEVNGVKLETGSHYYVDKTKADSIGKKITPQTLEEYGSVAIDPKKNRKIEWIVTGTRHPINVTSRMSLKANGIIWCEGIEEQPMKYIPLKKLI